MRDKEKGAAAAAVKQQKEKKTAHPWTEIAAQTSFDSGVLEVLAGHHRILCGFCSESAGGSADGEVDRLACSNSASSDAIGLSFAQYCLSLNTLLLHGSASQQFEYLFHAYAVESERGITRAELFQMLQDNFFKRSASETKQSNSKSSEDTDARHFERLYTWLKKHMAVYDQSRCGFLPLPTALEMLRAHPSALQHLQLQIDPLLRKLQENDAKYHEKAVTAQIQ